MQLAATELLGVHAGLLLLLGWSLQYTLPAAISFSIFSQIHDFLASMRITVSRAQAIVLITALCFVFWQAISVVWTSATFATFTLNYPLYQGTARVPEAIATWIGSKQGHIVFLNKLVRSTPLTSSDRSNHRFDCQWKLLLTSCRTLLHDGATAQHCECSCMSRPCPM